MTRMELIQAIYNDDDGWSCPNHRCDHAEHGNCMECADNLLSEYEHKVGADAIDEYNDAIKSHLRKLSTHFVSDKDFDFIAEQLKGEQA